MDISIGLTLKSVYDSFYIFKKALIFQTFILYSFMLKSIKSNNSPGHSHNRRLSVVDLSTDFCPGIILKRNNKMNEEIPKVGLTAFNELAESHESHVRQVTKLEKELKAEGKYNGWTNWETWNLKIWIENEENSYRYIKAKAKILPLGEFIAFLETWATTQWDARTATSKAGFVSDFLRHSFSRVNWTEIAESYLSEVRS